MEIRANSDTLSFLRPISIGSAAASRPRRAPSGHLVQQPRRLNGRLYDGL